MGCRANNETVKMAPRPSKPGWANLAVAGAAEGVESGEAGWGGAVGVGGREPGSNGRRERGTGTPDVGGRGGVGGVCEGGGRFGGGSEGGGGELGAKKTGRESRQNGARAG